jgi:carbamoyltransferase
MGLAAFGTPKRIDNRLEFLKSLDWTRAFPGGHKSAWEASPHLPLYRNVAASTQLHFEESLFQLLEKLRKFFPEFPHLILTGGCALNSVANGKILNSSLFRSVYIPPFPSDECISLGVAESLRLLNDDSEWRPTLWSRQHANFGPLTSVPQPPDILRVFPKAKKMTRVALSKFIARQLNQGQVVAWFEGRSESGPRALGFRSILASPISPRMRSYLNTSIKGRESFRPYGCSVPRSLAHLYFEVPPGFRGPFMSFAVPVRRRYRRKLRAVTHVDGTSRIQTVTRSHHPYFYSLLLEFGRVSTIPVLLNTSLNVMGEPLVETIEDAAHFLRTVKVDWLVICGYIVQREKD